jgi:hypothetical protein
MHDGHPTKTLDQRGDLLAARFQGVGEDGRQLRIGLQRLAQAGQGLIERALALAAGTRQLGAADQEEQQRSQVGQKETEQQPAASRLGSRLRGTT